MTSDSCANRIVVAAAGSGKTTYIVQEALRCTSERILVTTFTESNEAEIRKKFYASCGCIPSHVTVQTWFSFLIQHGVKPYQGGYLDIETRGLNLVSTASAPYVAEACKERYFLDSGHRIYSDKLAKLAVRCDGQVDGRVIKRIARVFPRIFIDEAQDLAGYDLDVLKSLFASEAQVVLVGDPRQVTYLTHHEQRHKGYREGRLREFIVSECKSIPVSVDDDLLRFSHRCCQAICSLSDALYPDMLPTCSRQCATTEHDGVFLVPKEKVSEYLAAYCPTQLRYNRKVQVADSLPSFNFGDSKGLTFDRVLIYPTKEMVGWLLDRSKALAPGTKARFYVALTRAKHSAAIVIDKRLKQPPNGVSVWPQCAGTPQVLHTGRSTAET